MTLRKKILLTSLVLVPLCAIALFVVCYQVILAGFSRVEGEKSQSHMQLVLRALGNEFSNGSKIELQLSAWDDTCRFMAEKHAGGVDNTSYIQTYYGKPEFVINQLNVVLMLDANGKLVFGRAYDFGKDSFVTLPPDLLEHLQSNPSWLKYDSPTQYKSGVLSLAQGPLMVIGEPIVTSNFQGPIHGTMIVGRFLNQREIAQLSQMTEQSISVIPLTKASVPADIITTPPDSSGITHSSTWVDRTNTNIFAQTVVYGIDHAPAFVLQVSEPRNTYHLGQTTVRDVVALITVGLITFGVLALIVLERAVFLRLRRFNEQLTAVQHTGDLSLRVDSAGHDEISLLAERFNRMMSFLEQSQKTILRQARFDALTGLPNRYELYDMLQRSIATSAANQAKMAVLFIDLDNFKAMNDSFGHDTGDLLLKSVTERLQAAVGNQGTVARLAGDEFVVLLYSVAGADTVADVANELLQVLEEPVWIHQQQLFVRASIGGSIFPTDGEDSESLLRHADIAMYYAKKDDQSKFHLITDGIKSDLERTGRLEQDLQAAIGQDQMYLVYQPKVDAKTNRISGIEALIRWNHPEFGQLAPGEFIHIAESTGMITALGIWVLRTACSQNMKWIEEGHMPVPVSVNVSPVQFAQDNFVQVVKRVLAETGLPATCLELEVTESIAMRTVERVNAKLQELKNLGLTVSVDDFGVGYSSLNYLKALPIDTVKIDRSFIGNVFTEGQDRTIVQAIIDLAHRLQMAVIAEGVETLEQLQFLKDSECDMIQGYLFSHPLPANSMAHVLKQEVIHPV